MIYHYFGLTSNVIEKPTSKIIIITNLFSYWSSFKFLGLLFQMFFLCLSQIFKIFSYIALSIWFMSMYGKNLHNIVISLQLK